MYTDTTNRFKELPATFDQEDAMEEDGDEAATEYSKMFSTRLISCLFYIYSYYYRLLHNLHFTTILPILLTIIRSSDTQKYYAPLLWLRVLLFFFPSSSSTSTSALVVCWLNTAVHHLFWYMLYLNIIYNDNIKYINTLNKDGCLFNVFSFGCALNEQICNTTRYSNIYITYYYILYKYYYHFI